MSRKILVILHQEHSTPGRVGRLLCERGYELDIRKPRFGDLLPRTLEGYAGVVIFGGPMSANDNEPWIKQEIDWISVPLKEEKPFLGICLGAQMLASHLGGRVARHRQGQVEIGYWPITPTGKGVAAMAWPSHVYHWHNEGFEAASGMEILATGDTFANQACRFGCAYGLQFHPEVTKAIMHRWTHKAADALTAPGAQDRNTQFSMYRRYDGAIRSWLHGFLDHWLEPPAIAAE